MAATVTTERGFLLIADLSGYTAYLAGSEPTHGPLIAGDFIDFVRVRLGDLQMEAARLTGGPGHADEVYPQALIDVAGHWRRLRLRHRLTRRDAAGDFLHQRLVKRAGQWREEQIYEVEVRLLRTPVIFDGRNIYSPEHMRTLGFTYFSIGR